MRVTLIYNPDAGGDHQPSGDDLLEWIHKAGHSATFQSSTDAAWERALQEAADVVAVAGGDGMVGQVAKRMIGKRVQQRIKLLLCKPWVVEGESVLRDDSRQQPKTVGPGQAFEFGPENTGQSDVARTASDQ